VVSETHPYGRILGFLDRSRYISFQGAPQLHSRGLVDLVPDTVLHRKSGGAENRTRTSGSVARNFDHYTTEAVSYRDIFTLFFIIIIIINNFKANFIYRFRLRHYPAIAKRNINIYERRLWRSPAF
jgi:hypothetical protein